MPSPQKIAFVHVIICEPCEITSGSQGQQRIRDVVPPGNLAAGGDIDRRPQRPKPGRTVGLGLIGGLGGPSPERGAPDWGDCGNAG